MILFFLFTAYTKNSCKESQYKLTSQTPNRCASQYNWNMNCITASIPNIRPNQLKSKEDDSNLYEQVQSTPLLSENKTNKTNRMLIKAPCPLLCKQKENACGWTWKSLDNIVDNDSQECNSRIYATRVDKNYTLYRKDIFYSGSVYNLKERNEDPTTNDEKSIPSRINVDKWRTHHRHPNSLGANTDLKPGECDEDKKSKLFRKIIHILSEMSNFSLFTDPLFLMYAISCTLTMFGKCENTLTLLLSV